MNQCWCWCWCLYTLFNTVYHHWMIQQTWKHIKLYIYIRYIHKAALTHNKILLSIGGNWTIQISLLWGQMIFYLALLFCFKIQAEPFVLINNRWQWTMNIRNIHFYRRSETKSQIKHMICRWIEWQQFSFKHFSHVWILNPFL